MAKPAHDPRTNYPIFGPDVSHWQGQVDWRAVRAGGSSFAIAKCTEGVGYKDPRFDGNFKGMSDEGLIRGAYHFARVSCKPTMTIREDAIREAEWFVKCLGKDHLSMLPPILDIEWDRRTRKIPPDAIVNWVMAWLENVEGQIGMRPIIYTGERYWHYKLAQTPMLRDYPLWLVQYKHAKTGMVAGPRKPIPRWDWEMWQYTSKGKIDGIKTPCDVNVYRGQLSTLLRWVESRYADRTEQESAAPLSLPRTSSPLPSLSGSIPSPQRRVEALCQPLSFWEQVAAWIAGQVSTNRQ